MNIVYLHGFASGPSSSKARYLRERLTRAGHNVEVPDLAAGNFEHLTISGQLDVADRAVAGRPVVLIGSSLGGYLAALYAAQHAEVTRVVLLAPAFDFARRWTERMGPLPFAEWGEKGWMEVFHYGEGRNRRLSFDLMADAVKYEGWPLFTQPGLIFNGTRDDVVPPEVAQEYARRNPHVELELVESGHELLNVLEYLGERIVSFLASG